MNKLLIPPTIIVYCIITMTVCFIILSSFQIIPLPYSLFGLVVVFIGMVIMGKAKELYQKHETTLQIKQSSSFITEGVFSKTRNPMYLGMFILLMGVGFCFGNLFSILTPLLFLFFVNFIVIPREEKLLTLTFGEEYLLYKQKVKRWL